MGVGLGVAVGIGVAVGMGVGETDALEIGDGETDAVAVGDADGLTVGAGEGVASVDVVLNSMKSYVVPASSVSEICGKPQPKIVLPTAD